MSRLEESQLEAAILGSVGSTRKISITESITGKKKGAKPFGLTPCFIGGDERDRTVDLCVANASLSQLSYIPMKY